MSLKNPLGANIFSNKFVSSLEKKKALKPLITAPQSKIKTIKVCSLSELTAMGFQSQGTGIYRDAKHHLWDVQKNADGFSLIRNAEEDASDDSEDHSVTAGKKESAQVEVGDKVKSNKGSAGKVVQINPSGEVLVKWSGGAIQGYSNNWVSKRLITSESTEEYCKHCGHRKSYHEHEEGCEFPMTSIEPCGCMDFETSKEAHCGLPDCSDEKNATEDEKYIPEELSDQELQSPPDYRPRTDTAEEVFGKWPNQKRFKSLSVKTQHTEQFDGLQGKQAAEGDLTQCRKCQEIFPKSEAVCPSCGAKQANKRQSMTKLEYLKQLSEISDQDKADRLVSKAQKDNSLSNEDFMEIEEHFAEKFNLPETTAPYEADTKDETLEEQVTRLRDQALEYFSKMRISPDEENILNDVINGIEEESGQDVDDEMAEHIKRILTEEHGGTKESNTAYLKLTSKKFPTDYEIEKLIEQAREEGYDVEDRDSIIRFVEESLKDKDYIVNRQVINNIEREISYGFDIGSNKQALVNPALEKSPESQEEIETSWGEQALQPKTEEENEEFYESAEEKKETDIKKPYKLDKDETKAEEKLPKSKKAGEYPDRPSIKDLKSKDESFYAEKDGDEWGIFDTLSGHCYATLGSESEAESRADNMNKEHGLGKYKNKSSLTMTAGEYQEALPKMRDFWDNVFDENDRFDFLNLAGGSELDIDKKFDQLPLSIQDALTASYFDFHQTMEGEPSEEDVYENIGIEMPVHSDEERASSKKESSHTGITEAILDEMASIEATGDQSLIDEMFNKVFEAAPEATTDGELFEVLSKTDKGIIQDLLEELIKMQHKAESDPRDMSLEESDQLNKGYLGASKKQADSEMYQYGFEEGQNAAEVNYDLDPDEIKEKFESDEIGEIAAQVLEHQQQMEGTVYYRDHSDEELDEWESGFYEGFADRVEDLLSEKSGAAEGSERDLFNRDYRPGEIKESSEEK